MSIRFPFSRHNPNGIAVAAIVAYSAIVHGLLLFNDGIYFDGWLIHTSLKDSNWHDLFRWFSEAGFPGIAYFHWFMGYLPNSLLAYKLVTFTSITLSGILVYLICNEVKIIDRTQSFFIALLSLAYPAYQVSVETIMTPYSVCYCLFLGACFLALKSEGTGCRRPYALRASAWILWFMSFTINSLLALYYGFFLILTLVVLRDRHVSLKRLFTEFLPRHADYLLFPLLYWALLRHFFPAHGLYSTYNKLIFNFHVFPEFIDRAILAQLSNVLINLAGHAAIVAPMLVLIAFILWTVKRPSKEPQPVDRRENPYAVIAAGFLLLFLGILPYAAVNKAPSVHGWETRHSLLVALPVAMILVGTTSLLFARTKPVRAKTGLFFLTILALAFGFSSIENYLSWQARWVKDRSVMENLRTTREFDHVSVIWVDDQFQVGGEETYRFYEWSSMFKNVWGDEKRIGLDKRIYTPDFLTKGVRYFNDQYNLSEFDPGGAQLTLSIRRGPNASGDASLSARYLFYRFFRPDHLVPFLHGVTSVHITGGIRSGGGSLARSLAGGGCDIITLQNVLGYKSLSMTQQYADLIPDGFFPLSPIVPATY